jgi:hypothetical protein
LISGLMKKKFAVYGVKATPPEALWICDGVKIP